jgi:hypothetical protein
LQGHRERPGHGQPLSVLQSALHKSRTLFMCGEPKKHWEESLNLTKSLNNNCKSSSESFYSTMNWTDVGFQTVEITSRPTNVQLLEGFRCVHGTKIYRLWKIHLKCVQDSLKSGSTWTGTQNNSVKFSSCLLIKTQSWIWSHIIHSHKTNAAYDIVTGASWDS